VGDFGRDDYILNPEVACICWIDGKLGGNPVSRLQFLKDSRVGQIVGHGHRRHETTRGEALESACTLEASKAGLRVEGYTPPDEVIAAVERIVQAAGIDVGGIEYIVDDRDGKIYYYDVNALSNFVADPLRVIGFNPFERLADFLEQEIEDAR
jgi:hypothetical protein